MKAQSQKKFVQSGFYFNRTDTTKLFGVAGAKVVAMDTFCPPRYGFVDFEDALTHEEITTWYVVPNWIEIEVNTDSAIKQLESVIKLSKTLGIDTSEAEAKLQLVKEQPAGVQRIVCPEDIDKKVFEFVNKTHTLPNW